MSGFINSITGSSAAKSAEQTAQQQAGLAQSQSGQQLRLLASQQATADQAAAAASAPGIGQAMLKYNRRDGAQTLGG